MNVEFEHGGGGRGPGPSRRRVVIIAVVTLALLVPGVALGSHLFDDVPDTHTFHGSINNLALAGITAGCDEDNYCPQANVTRGQMAAFLNRGLGRVAEVDSQTSVTGNGSSTPAQLTITPGIPGGAVPGAGQFLRAEYTGTIRFTDVTDCPCSVAVYLTANGVSMSNFATATTVSVANQYTPLTTSGVVAVSGSSPVTVSLTAYMVSGGGALTAYTIYANVSAELFAFGSTGSNTLSAPGEVPDDDPLALPRGD